MNQVFEEFAKGFKNDEIVTMKRKPNLHEIIVYANEDKFDLWSQLKRINKLYDKYMDKSLWKKFVLTEIIFVRKCYISTYIFRSKRSMVSVVVVEKRDKFFFLRYGHEVVTHMKQLVSYNVFNKLHSISITRAFCYLRNRNYSHVVSYIQCFRFECRLMHLVCQIIVKSGDERYLFHLNVNNYDDFDDVEILGKTLVSSLI